MRGVFFCFLGGAGFWLGCGDGSAPPAPDAGLGPAPMLGQACSNSMGELYVAPSGLPSYDATHRGDVVRCSVGSSLTASDVNAQATAHGYAGPSLPSGFWIYRLVFRTERVPPAAGGSAPEALSVAFLLLPEKPVAGAPLVVFAHGSVGVAPGCAPTHFDVTAPVTNQLDFLPPLFALAGYGYTVIAPDYAGFAFGETPGYFVAGDEAHGVLDATRAAANLLPADRRPGNVVLVGHSQGGHAALSAHSLAPTYGLSGTLVGVAMYAPFWISMFSWGAIISPAVGFQTGTASQIHPILYAMEYFYSEGELLDGPGGGLAMFQADKRTAVQQVLVGGTCFDDAGLQALGATPADFFDSTFTDSVGTACGFGDDCSSGPAAIWGPRFVADRPPIDDQGPPILIWLGGADTTVAPRYAQCIRERLTANLAGTSATTTVRYCYDATADHKSIVRTETDYINKWIAAQVGAGADPGVCPEFPVGDCFVPPPNE